VARAGGATLTVAKNLPRLQAIPDRWHTDLYDLKTG